MSIRSIGGWFVVLAALAAPAHAGLVNIAPSAKVSQSSTTYDGAAGRAIDGITSGLWGYLSVTATSNAPGQWLQLDLGGKPEIHEVIVHNRTDAGGVNGIGMRLDQAVVTLSNVPCGGGGGALATSAPLDGKKLINRVVWPAPINAQYVCVRQPRAEYLSVAEVEVLVPDALVVEDNLVNIARSGERNNLAIGAAARQSSTASFRVFATSIPGTADKAIDGNRSSSINYWSLTGVAANNWLEVNLGDLATIGEVKLHNRSTNPDWLNGAMVELAAMPCDAPGFTALETRGPFAGAVAQQAFSFPATTAQFVCVRQPRTVALSLAELEVIEAFPGDRLVNLARGRPAIHFRQSFASPSSDAGWLTDGDPSVVPASVGPANQPHGIQLDLGDSPVDVASVILHGAALTDLGTVTAQLWVAAPGEVCATQMANGLGVATAPLDWHGRARVVYLPPRIRGRYLCLVAFNYMAISEIQVFGEDRQNLARGKPATTSGLASGGAAALTDGVTTAAVQLTAVANPWIELDLGATPAEADTITIQRAAGSPATGLELAVGTEPCSAGPGTALDARPRIDGVIRADVPPGIRVRYLCLRGPAAALKITELEAFAAAAVPRFPAVAHQSSTGYGAGAMRAIDGRRGGLWSTADLTVTSVISDVPNDTAPWLAVDLIRAQPIRDVVIFNRGDGCCPERLYGARIELSLDPCEEPWRRVVAEQRVPGIDERKALVSWKWTAYGSVARRTQVDFPTAPTARYVCVRHDRRQFLSLGEIEVHTGEPIENLARRGLARQSTTYGGDTGATADRAIDGWTDGQYSFGSVSHTADPADTPAAAAAPPWFEIDLLGQAAVADPTATLEAPEIRGIDVYNRTDAATERLTGAIVELSARPCDVRVPGDVVWSGTVIADVIGVEPPRRTSFRLLDRTPLPRARYVCVRRAAPSILQLAEVQVFGTGLETAPAPERKPTPILPPSAMPSEGPPPAIAAVTAPGGASTTLTVKYGTLSLPACTFARVGDADGDGKPEYTMTCPGVPDDPAITMEGTIAGGAYDLTSVGAVSLADLLASGLFATLWPSELRAAFTPLSLADVRLRLTSARGFFLDASVALDQLPGGDVVSRTLAGAHDFLSTLGLGAAYQPARRLELIPTLAAQTPGAIIRILVVDGVCLGPSSVPGIGAGFKLAEGALVFSLAAGTGGVQIAGGLDGLAYVKPTANDPWLAFEPAIELGAGARAQSVSIKGRVAGACEATCASTCGCALTQCAAPWNPVGMSSVELRQGYVELGASTVASVTMPIVNLSFADVRVGSIHGEYAVAFDYSKKSFGFRLAADRLPLLTALELMELDGLSSAVPAELAIDQPVLSFSSSDIALFGVTIPKGVRIKGGLDLPSVGLRGSVDARLNGQSLIDLEGSVTQRKLVLGGPSGRIALAFDADRLLDKVLGVIPLDGFAREVLERSFWITGFDIGLTVGTTVGVDVDVRYRLFGHRDHFSVGASFDLEHIAGEIATALQGLVGDVGTAIAGAFNAAVDQAREVAGKIQSAMQAGGAVLVNGVLTVYSKVLPAADPAIAGLVDLAESAWSFATSCFGFC